MSIVSDTSALFVAVGVSWLVIGIALSIVMGRRGHNGFGWLVLGTLLGPLGVVLAVDAWRHSEQAPPAPLGAGIPPIMGTGPVDVLVGFDGSPESIAVIDAVVELFGDRLGRLTVTTVVPFGDIRLQERLAREALLRLGGRTPGWTLELEVLHGHPSVAIGQYATENDYDVIAVGTRGTGITKAILGSAASELARHSKVPVLVVGGAQADPPAYGTTQEKEVRNEITDRV